MLLVIVKVLLVLVAAFVAWFVLAGAVLDLLFRRAEGRQDDEPYHTPPPRAGPGPLR